MPLFEVLRTRDFIQNMSQALSKCLSKWIKVDKWDYLKKDLQEFNFGGFAMNSSGLVLEPVLGVPGTGGISGHYAWHPQMLGFKY